MPAQRKPKKQHKNSMLNNSGQVFIIYLLSISIAMALRIAPWPSFISSYNPDWILIVLLYWSLTLPERFGVLNAWFIGLLTDVLTGRLMGQHALAYAVTSYLGIKLYKRLRQFRLFQQGLFIFINLTLSQTIVFWTEDLQAPAIYQLNFWLPVIAGTLCWPFVYILLRSICTARKIF